MVLPQCEDNYKIELQKIIDSSSQKQWEKYIFEDSFTEFLMQSQYFDQQKKYSSFSELIANVPNAEKLHLLVALLFPAI